MSNKWKPEEHLGEKIKIKIDRPMGSKHPKHGFIYPINYGYVPGVIGGDGEEFDAYLLGVFEPVKEYEGRLIGIIHRDDDVEEKLVIAPRVYSEEQITALVEFQEKWFNSWVSYHYDKPCWPEEEPYWSNFNINTPEVQNAIKFTIKYGVYSIGLMGAKLNKGYGYATRLGFWLEDNGIVGKQYSLGERNLKVDTYEEAILKIESHTDKARK